MNKALSLLANVSLLSAKKSANSLCGFILHEPKMPESAKKLIKK